MRRRLERDFNLIFQYRMVDIQKHSLLKKHNEQHKHLIKKYKVHFNPLFLPKLAVYGYKLKPDPSCLIFFSKLQLTDKAIIQKENQFIDIMKRNVNKDNTRKSQGKEGEPTEELTTTHRDGKCGTVSENQKHRYSKILENRLKDLEELIFHIDRLKQPPVLEEECRQLLKKEIQKISQNTACLRKTETKTKKDDTSSISESQLLFSFSQFKRKEKKDKQLAIKTLYENHKSNRRFKRMATEPQEGDSLSNMTQTNKNQSRNSQTETQINIFVQSNVSSAAEQQKRKPLKKYSKFHGAGRYNSMTSQVQNIHNGKENVAQREEFLGHDTNKQSRPRINHHSKRTSRIGGKTVRYQLETQGRQQIPRQSTSSRVKSNKPVRFKQPNVFKMVATNATKKSNRTSRSSIKKKLKSNKDEEQDSELSQIQIIPAALQESEAVLGAGAEQIVDEEKKQYMTPVESSKKLRARRNNKPKLSAFYMWQNQDGNIQLRPKLESKLTKRKPTRIIKAQEGQQQEEDKIKIKITPQGQKSAKQIKGSKNKRNGKMIGPEANKHLVRLLKQKHVQEMIESQLQDRNNKAQGCVSGTKKRWGQTAIKDNNNFLSKQYFNQKSKIMMEVDFQASSRNIRGKYYEDYVDSKGLAVTGQDLKTLRQTFVNVIPYHHATMDIIFNGGKSRACGQYQFVTNQMGQYAFNRNFIRNIKSQTDEDDFFPYRFSECDPCDHLAFQLSKKLVYSSSDVRQKKMVESSMLMEQPGLIPLQLF